MPRQCAASWPTRPYRLWRELRLSQSIDGPPSRWIIAAFGPLNNSRKESKPSGNRLSRWATGMAIAMREVRLSPRPAHRLLWIATRRELTGFIAPRAQFTRDSPIGGVSLVITPGRSGRIARPRYTQSRSTNYHYATACELSGRSPHQSRASRQRSRGGTNRRISRIRLQSAFGHQILFTNGSLAREFLTELKIPAEPLRTRNLILC